MDTDNSSGALALYEHHGMTLDVALQEWELNRALQEWELNRLSHR